MKELLIIAHCPSTNTQAMASALLEGANRERGEGVTARLLSPFATGPEDVIGAAALILLTPENLGYMSGALKDFFDRCYYPCLEVTQGKPCAAVIRAGHDGTGTRRALQTILTGLRWRLVQEPLVCRGEWREHFLADCTELGAALAAGLDAGIF